MKLHYSKFIAIVLLFFFITSTFFKQKTIAIHNRDSLFSVQTFERTVSDVLFSHSLFLEKSQNNHQLKRRILKEGMVITIQENQTLKLSK